MQGKEYKLVEICDLITCGVAKRPEYFESGIPFLSSKNVKRNKILFKDYNFISPEMHHELTKKNKPQRGDILYTRVGSFGEAAVIDFDDEFSVFVSLTLIKPKRKIVDAYYLMQFLNSEIVQALAKRSTIGNGVQNLNVNSVREFKIILPPISKQIHIANILNKAERLIEQRKRSIALLDEFLKSTFLEMFGDPELNEKNWEKLNAGEYCDKLTVGVVIKPASHYVKDGVIALRSLNIRPNKIVLNNLVYFSKEKNEGELSKSILREGDVVFVRTGVTGTAAIIPKELDGCNCIDLIISRPNRKIIHPSYLVFFFNSDFGKRAVSARAVGGIQKHFNIGAIKALRIPVPPIELQTQFANIVSKTEKLKEQYKNSLHELENLYGCLSQKAFKGELKIVL